MKTRSEPQVRSHAQKHFLRISRLEKQNSGDVAKPSSDGQVPKSTTVSDLEMMRQGRTGVSDEKKRDLKNNTKRRRMTSNNSNLNSVFAGQLPDAFLTMAAQAAAAAQVQPQDYGGAYSPQLLQSLALQQQQQQQQQPASKKSKTSPRGGDSESFNYNQQQQNALLQSLGQGGPYALHQVGNLQQQMHQAQLGQGYYNYIPFPAMRPDAATPSWNNMAVATSLGMAQSPWILPMTNAHQQAFLPNEQEGDEEDHDGGGGGDDQNESNMKNLQQENNTAAVSAGGQQ